MTKVILGTNGTSRGPEFAGSIWVRLQYMLGLQRLGIKCFWVDQLATMDPCEELRSVEYVTGRFHQTACEFGFADRYCIVYNGGERYFGLSERQLRALTKDAGLLLNINGHLPDNSPLARVPRRAFIDVDPGFTQMWALGRNLGFDRHNFHFTVGQNVGRPGFQIPTGNIQWQPLLPPVVLDLWPARIDPRCQAFSTVADWRGSQHAVFKSKHYVGKRPEFLRFLKLPQRVKQRIDLALLIGAGDYVDMRQLVDSGWNLLDSYLYAGNPHSYREFIQSSRAEFSVAKNGYVRANTGWVSDRTACYLSSGKPALVQSTGFEQRLPTGQGLLTFRTLSEAVAGIEAINKDYASHCRAARKIAEKHFSSDVVLGRLLERVGM